MRNNSQRSLGKNGHYKLLRNIVMSAIALVFLAGCDCEDPVIKTHQEALEALKKKVLSDPEYLKQLRAVGADESIFDNVQVLSKTVEVGLGYSHYPCNRPKKYSLYTKGLGNQVLQQVSTYEIVKASCDKCWNLVMISAVIARCGNLYELDIQSKPTPSLATKPGHKREQCGPAYDYP